MKTSQRNILITGVMAVVISSTVLVYLYSQNSSTLPSSTPTIPTTKTSPSTGHAPVIGLFAIGGPLPWMTQIQAHQLASPDFGASFTSAANLNRYPASMDKIMMFDTYTVPNDAAGINTVDSAANANGYQFTGYDNEPCNGALSTPIGEYSGMYGATQSLNGHYTELSAALVHSAGLRFIMAPSNKMLTGGIAGSCTPSGTQITALQGLDWTKVDGWILQAEGQSGVSEVVSMVQQYAVPAKTANPNIKIYVEVNPAKQNLSAADVASLWSQLQPLQMTGLVFVVHASDTSASYFDQILNAVGR